jgi:hypothetical protein
MRENFFMTATLTVSQVQDVTFLSTFSRAQINGFGTIRDLGNNHLNLS